MISTKAEYAITPFPHILLDTARDVAVISYAPGKMYPLDQLFAQMQVFDFTPREMASRLREVTGGMMTKGMIFCALAYLDEHPELHDKIAERKRRMWRRDDIFDSVVAHV